MRRQETHYQHEQDKVMPLEPLRIDYPIPIPLRRETILINTTRHVKLLGVKFQSNLAFTMHIEEAARKAKSAALQLKNLVRSTSVQDYKLVIRLYRTIIRPTMDYGAEIWAKHDYFHGHHSSIGHLDSLQHECLKYAIPGPNSISGPMY